MMSNFPVDINRDAKITLYPFSDYFQGFEKIEAVKALFGDKTEDVLSRLKIEFVDSPFRTIFPNEDDGHLIVGVDYLRKGDVKSIYLGVLLCLNFLKRISEGGQFSSLIIRGGSWRVPFCSKRTSRCWQRQSD